MVHGLMAQSGGELVLKSVVGEGTTAELWLPLADKGEVEVTAAPVLEAPLDPAPTALTVLAVDDDSLVLMNTVSSSKIWGWRPSRHHRARKLWLHSRPASCRT